MTQFTFHTSAQYNSLIRAYAYHLWSQSHQHTDDVIEILYGNEMSGNAVLTFGFTAGRTYEFNYKGWNMLVRQEESAEFKGTGAGLGRWMDLYITLRATENQKTL